MHQEGCGNQVQMLFPPSHVYSCSCTSGTSYSHYFELAASEPLLRGTLLSLTGLEFDEILDLSPSTSTKLVSVSPCRESTEWEVIYNSCTFLAFSQQPGPLSVGTHHHRLCVLSPNRWGPPKALCFSPMSSRNSTTNSTNH